MRCRRRNQRRRSVLGGTSHYLLCLCCVYTYMHYRQLCFEEWRGKQRDEVPDSEFDDHWSNLSSKAKKVRLLIYPTTSPRTLLYLSGVPGPGSEERMSLLSPQFFLCLTSHSHRLQVLNRALPGETPGRSPAVLRCRREGVSYARGGPRVCGCRWCGWCDDPDVR